MGLLNWFFGPNNEPEDSNNDDYEILDSDMDEDAMLTQYEFDGYSSSDKNRTHSGNGTKLN